MMQTQPRFSLTSTGSRPAAFSPASRPAPLVLGHPKDDQPAYGQVRGLFVKDGDLFAQAVVL